MEEVVINPPVEGWEPNQEMIHHNGDHAGFVTMDGIVYVGESRDGLFLAVVPRSSEPAAVCHPSPNLAKHIALEILRRTGTEIQFEVDGSTDVQREQ